MEAEDRRRRLLSKLFQTQLVAVLATQDSNGPYASLMAFAVTEDLKHIIFATDRTTRKFVNITENPRVALLIDDRTVDQSDLHGNIAVTAMGRAAPVSDEEAESVRALFVSKHPELEEFVGEPACAFLKCTVEQFYIVAGFQDVVEFKPE